jgi:secondary thiamine-phosphate synthase enzyme
MKTLTEYLKFHTKTHRSYVHITPQVEEIVRKSGVQDGMALVSAMHITAGVYVNDNESGLIEDIDQWLEHLAPFRKNYKHHETGEDNGDSHLKALLIHHEVIVPITGGKLDLGTWQRIFYAEFDGQRRQTRDCESHGRVRQWSVASGGQWSVSSSNLRSS